LTTKLHWNLEQALMWFVSYLCLSDRYQYHHVWMGKNLR